MSKWLVEKQEADIGLMTKVLKIHPVLAQAMVNRGVRTKNNSLRYLHPSPAFMHDPGAMKDLPKAVEIALASARSFEKIAVYGDYDVDGVTATVILYKILKKFGADVTYYIPHREDEGYGLNSGAVRDLRESEVDLIIACDNGIAAHEEVREAKELGLKVVVLDHHEPSFLEDNGLRRDVLPPADAVVDPKQRDCTYPFKLLSAAGIAYKFAELFCRTADIPFDESDEFMVFAMLATFCDIVDLLDENRIIVKTGLDILNRNKHINLGLGMLIDEKGFAEKQITEYVVGFILGPCINATGRLERATLAVELFLCGDPDQARTQARKLAELNEERKSMTSAAVTRVLGGLKSDIPNVIVVYDEEVHESIAGIVAGRIKETLCRPTIVLTRGVDCVKGSARSIEGYNIFSELYRCRKLFLRFGGHPMAAGMSLRRDNIEPLRRALNENFTLQPEDLIPEIKIDEELSLRDATYELADALRVMGPFGKGNKSPLFLTRGLAPEQLKVYDDKNMLTFAFPVPDSPRLIRAVGFGLLDKFQEQVRGLYDAYEANKILNGVLRSAGLSLDVVYSLEINEYNNQVSVQMKLKDFLVKNPAN
ncbi:MAG: single-stranded-DNA-specific exonuclease RecJ [Clostridiales bacterium]|jgi:single-stranded-DNA-specific exonuclease|nr:single-stranded-DNA-specific exonuclease RecJ [Clostridiales bacterium]